ncbi:MAG: hypothetical protein JO337_00600 [Acidimicrobiales bacterium]|nr:hypothetical protein [Acidimicrobiales bacterium]
MSSFDFTEAGTWAGRSVARKISQAQPRGRLVVTGTISGAGVVDIGGSRSGSYTLDDGTGQVELVFLGRPKVAGLSCGVRLTVEGTSRMDRGKLVVWNPLYRIEPSDDR